MSSEIFRFAYKLFNAVEINLAWKDSIKRQFLKENGDSIQLGKRRTSVKMMVKSIKEGFITCKRLGMPITPNNLKIIFMKCRNGSPFYMGKKQCKVK